MRPGALDRLIGRSVLVSFDVFDTAVLRAVADPHDVFTLAARLLKRRGGPLGTDFRSLRVAAEVEARRIAWAKRGEVEVTLEGIYACVERALRNAGRVLSPDKLAQQMKLAEIETELSAALPNPAVKRLFEDCLRKGIRVAFTSDMYLPREVIEDILKRCGYGRPPALLLSSERLRSKAAGGLFDDLIREAGCPPERILHIGDNAISDGERAREKGLIAVVLPKPRDVDRARPELAGLAPEADCGRDEQGADGPDGAASRPCSASMARSAVRAALMNALCAGEPPPRNERERWRLMGYRSFGPLLHAYAAWLFARAARDGVSALYFLSRDGHIQKLVFDLYSEIRGGKAVGSHYLYASRRAWNMAAFESAEGPVLDFLVSGTSRLTVGNFLSRCGLDPDEHAKALRLAGLPGPGHMVSTGEDYGRLRVLFARLEGALRDVAKSERAALLASLDQAGFLAEPGPALSDIGWHGSLQESLVRLLDGQGHARPVPGYYLGTFEAARSRSHLPMRAFLCRMARPSRRFELVSSGVEVLETAHLAPHGSLLRFGQGASGRAEPVFDAASFDAQLAARVKHLHEGILDFVRYFSPRALSLGITIGPDAALAPLARLLTRPERWEADLLGEVQHAEGFGEVHRLRKIAPKPGLAALLRGPGAIAAMRENSFWKAGFDRRLWPGWLRRRV